MTIPADIADRRIIPACAGSTSLDCAGHRMSRDHPRLRGEHDRWDFVTTLKRGSSPPARGAHRP